MHLEQVYSSMFDTYGPYLARGARRLGVPPSAVDDVLQEVFIVVFRRLPDFAFEGNANVRSWVYAILVNEVRHFHRKQKRKNPECALGRQGPEPDTLVDSRGDPERSVERSEAIKEMYCVLDKLKEDRREVFVLAELEELTVPEIAAVLGENANTIYSRLSKARGDFERGLARCRAKRSR